MIFSFIVIGIFAIVTYVDMPAPNKLKNKIIDINDEIVKTVDQYA